MALLDKLFKKEKKEKKVVKSEVEKFGKKEKELIHNGKKEKEERIASLHLKPQATKKPVNPLSGKRRKKSVEAYRILKRPLITEKAIDLNQGSQYTFEVARGANKVEVKKAVESIFGVHVINVRSLNVRGRIRKYRGKKGKTPDWKKAIVTLKKGEKIEVAEGV